MSQRTWRQPLSFFTSTAFCFGIHCAYSYPGLRLEKTYMPSARRSLGRNDWRGVFLLCCSPSGAPQTLPPRPELLLKMPTLAFPPVGNKQVGPTLWRASPERHPMQERTKCLRCSTWPDCCSLLRRRHLHRHHLPRKEWQGWIHGGRPLAGLAEAGTDLRKRSFA